MKVEYGNVAEDAVWAGSTRTPQPTGSAWLTREGRTLLGEFATDPEGYRKLCDEIRRLGSPWPQAWSARAPMAQGS